MTNQIVTPRDRDIGGFFVHRLLPAIGRKAVGPFVFLDHMGPADLAPGDGIDVRPHPHIGLATVTFLFDGAIMHRDSLGSEQVIRPGDVNWMTAGSGVVHSERTPPEERRAGSRLEGIQCWVALPKKDEETAPSFAHHAESALPCFTIDGVELRLILGTAFGKTSPVRTFGDMIYLDAQMPEGARLEVPAGARELGAYLARGDVLVNGEPLPEKALAVGHAGADLTLTATRASRVMIIGGVPLPEPRQIWWNFVSSSKERIEQAKADWAAGRFPKVPGDEKEWIPLPE
jgi:redox-sensitive bicupin YhaK (pirin superfamily)